MGVNLKIKNEIKLPMKKKRFILGLKYGYPRIEHRIFQY